MTTVKIILRRSTSVLLCLTLLSLHLVFVPQARANPALRVKTIEFAFPQNDASLAAATRFDFAAITLNIPETTSRTFRSVIVQVDLRDDSSAAPVSMTSWLIGIKLAAVAFNDVTTTDTITNTAEQSTFRFHRDVVSYFNTNFGAGTSQTAQVGISFGGLVTANHAVKLIITYESEEQATRIRTVKIPLDGATTLLTATLAKLGTNQVPLLDTYLPESTKVFRNIFFEAEANEAATVATTYQLGLQLDAAAEVLDAVHQQFNISAVWYHRLWVQNSMTTSAVHAFKARSTLASTFTCLSVVLVVTYEYDHSASTTIMNHIALPLGAGSETGFAGGGVLADQEQVRQIFTIEEPATIALVQSGVVITHTSNAATTLNIAAGAQADRAYTTGQGLLTAGQYGLSQRVDAGGVQGAGITLARGTNTFTLKFYATAVGLAPGLTGTLYLNYTSGKHANGDGVHNHTTAWALADTAADVLGRQTVAAAPNIPEASYWQQAVAFVLTDHGLSASRGSGVDLHLKAEILTGELGADGWAAVFSPLVHNDANQTPVLNTFMADGGDIFDRYPNETEDRLALETARKYRMDSPLSTSWDSLYMLLTYHAISYTISGSVTNSGGGTVSIAAYRTDTGGKIDSTSRIGNGTYSITWYDNTVNVFTEARESATLIGRSDNGVAQ